MANANLVFVGIKGTAMALDRATGTVVWQTHLKGSDFVNLILDGDNLYATAQGEIFCLDPATGNGRWNNPLRGYGWGLVSIAVAGNSGNSTATLAAVSNLLAEEERRRREQQSAATTAT